MSLNRCSERDVEVALKSYKVVDRKGYSAFVIIASDNIPLPQLNRMLQNGANLVVTSEPSELVNKKYVD